MKLSIPIEDWPEWDSRSAWSRILNVSTLTMDRAQKTGKLGEAVHVNRRVKLFSKAQILGWLGLKDPAAPPAP